MAAAIFIAKTESSLRMNLPMEQERTKRMAAPMALWISIKFPLGFSVSKVSPSVFA